MEIDVLVDEGFEGCPELEWLRNFVEQVLLMQKSSFDAELGLVITTQEKVQELNRSYRGIDEPTDVLAFALGETRGTELTDFIAPPDGMLHLGEVIISYPQAVIQAKEHQHSVKREIAILIIHGVLHLLGYDHVEPEGERTMTAEEKKILNCIEGMLT